MNDAHNLEQPQQPNDHKETITMNPFEADYKSLHAAALSIGAKMLATLPNEQLEAMERMTKSGAKLMFQIELPDCKNIALVLREIEGKTWPVCKLGASYE